MRYDHVCAEHGEFEVSCRITETQREWPCPECGSGSPKIIRFSADQILTPAHFQTTLPKTGLAPGGWEDHSRKFNRWDSGVPGLKKERVGSERRKGTKVFLPGKGWSE